jgi:hypothetical protein
LESQGYQVGQRDNADKQRKMRTVERKHPIEQFSGAQGPERDGHQISPPRRKQATCGGY